MGIVGIGHTRFGNSSEYDLADVLAYAALSFFPYDLLVSWREQSAKLSHPGLSAFVVAGSCGGVVGCSVKLVTEVAIAAPVGALLGLSFARVRIASAFALNGVPTGVLLTAGVAARAVGLAAWVVGLAGGSAVEAAALVAKVSERM